MVSEEVLEKCTSQWLELNDAEKEKWALKTGGTKMEGYRAFMDECIAENRPPTTTKRNKNGRDDSLNQMRWLGLFMGKP